MPAQKAGQIHDETDLAQNLFQKAIENRDNPIALKTYIESYVRMADRTKTFQIEQQQPNIPGLKYDFDELRVGRPTEKIKKIGYGILALRHPYWSPEPGSRDEVVREDYRRWKQVLVATLEPLFAGKEPGGSEDC